MKEDHHPSKNEAHREERAASSESEDQHEKHREETHEVSHSAVSSHVENLHHDASESEDAVLERVKRSSTPEEEVEVSSVPVDAHPSKENASEIEVTPEREEKSESVPLKEESPQQDIPATPPPTFVEGAPIHTIVQVALHSLRGIVVC